MVEEIATFNLDFPTTDTYLNLIDMIQGDAMDCGTWKLIDPTGAVYLTEPNKPKPSDYKRNTVKFADLDDDDKVMINEDNA